MALQLDVITPDGTVVSTQADYVGVPCTEGCVGILPGHVSFLSSLAIGTLYYTVNSERHDLFVSGGFVEVYNNKVTVLAETAEKVENIDISRAEAAKRRAEQRLQQSKTDTSIDPLRAQFALTRAITRLKLANR